MGEPQDRYTAFLGCALNGRFVLTRLLGAGGFGGVFEAHDQVLERSVAVKILTPELSGEAHRQRFRREAKLLARLRHPNIVDIIDFGEEDGLLFLVMGLVRGEPLSKYMVRSAPLPASQVVVIAEQILLGLEAAHAQGMIHRDLKPENILVEQDGPNPLVVRLVDFGTATLLVPGDSFRTVEGHFFGTPAYMSPEQCRNQPQDARSDLYSFGCVLYQLLCGSPPFLGGGPIETLLAHAGQAPILPSIRAPRLRIHPGLEQVTMACLAKKPEERPESAAAVRRALGAAMREEHPSPPGRRVPLTPPEPVRPGMLPDAVLWVTGDSSRAGALKGLLEQLQVEVLVRPVLPPVLEGLPALVLLEARDPHLERWCTQCRKTNKLFVVLGDAEALEGMTRAIELGAQDYVSLPAEEAPLRRVLGRAWRTRRSSR